VLNTLVSDLPFKPKQSIGRTEKTVLPLIGISARERTHEAETSDAPSAL
jgi:hypothetical protein